MGRARVSNALLDDLQSADPQVRWRAAASLAKQRTPQVAQALAGALYDPEPFVRWTAAQALGEVASRASDRAVPITTGQALLDAARASDLGPRAAAADAIAAWGVKAPLEPLLALAQDSEVSVRAAAVRALGLVGGHAAQVVTPALLHALDDPDAEVRRVAASAITWCRDGAAPDALVAHLNDPANTVRAAALRALAKVSAGEHEAIVLPMLQDDDPAVRAEAIRFLRTWGSTRSIEPLVAMQCDATQVGEATLGMLAADARRHIAHRQQRWRGWLLRLRERWQRHER